jgi:hypothetical protein
MPWTREDLVKEIDSVDEDRARLIARVAELEITNRNLTVTCEDRENAAQAYFADVIRATRERDNYRSALNDIAQGQTSGLAPDLYAYAILNPE